MMYGYGYGPGSAGAGIWMMLGFWLFGVMLLVGIVLLVVWAVRRGGATHVGTPMYGPTAGRMDPAHMIARERLAKGEITQEEYDAIMRALGS